MSQHELDALYHTYYHTGYQQGVQDTKDKIMNVIDEPVSVTVGRRSERLIVDVIKQYRQKLRARIESALSSLISSGEVATPKHNENENRLNNSKFMLQLDNQKKYRQLDAGTVEVVIDD